MKDKFKYFFDSIWAALICFIGLAILFAWIILHFQIWPLVFLLAGFTLLGNIFIFIVSRIFK